MARATTSSSQRARRSSTANDRLERARQRNAQQLAEQREREKRVERALRDYVAAMDKIGDAERSCEDRVAELQRRIEQLREQVQQKVTGERARQARAALTIHEAGRTVEQVADLLEVSLKEARRLIAAGREDTAGSQAPVGRTRAAAGTARGTGGNGADGQDVAAAASEQPPEVDQSAEEHGLDEGAGDGAAPEQDVAHG